MTFEYFRYEKFCIKIILRVILYIKNLKKFTKFKKFNKNNSHEKSQKIFGKSRGKCFYFCFYFCFYLFTSIFLYKLCLFSINQIIDESIPIIVAKLT